MRWVFFLTTGFLGMMYYFVPKQAERPVYSYRLSIVHFWALITLYIWAGPHHLHYTALPDWAQSLGMVMSLILLVPSWGGMINGMMTLTGAWHKLRTDPILRFLVLSLAFYGMSTFEGPMMAIKTVNSLSHYTDWTIGHVHAGALGWVAMITIGSTYHMLPRVYGRDHMHSIGLINLHFWLATVGTVLYICAMWVNGITQGLMWRAINEDGTLAYSFVEGLQASAPGYFVRMLGGLIYASGMLVMAYTCGAPCAARIPSRLKLRRRSLSWSALMKHEIIEKNLGLMALLMVVAVAIGGLTQIVPLFFEDVTNKPIIGMKPRPALEVEGRDVSSPTAASVVTRR